MGACRILSLSRLGLANYLKCIIAPTHESLAVASSGNPGLARKPILLRMVAPLWCRCLHHRRPNHTIDLARAARLAAVGAARMCVGSAMTEQVRSARGPKLSGRHLRRG